MQLHEIKALVKAVRAAGVVHFTYETAEEKLELSFLAQLPAATDPQPGADHDDQNQA